MVAQVQKPAPVFSGPAVIDGIITDISSQDLLGQWVILLFYPLDFTFVCPTEILAFNDSLQAFKAINTTVIGVSTDSHYSHLAWSQRPRAEGGLGPDLKLPLLADKSMRIAREYGVLLEDEGIALRGLFIIDPKGVLRQITVNDLPVGRSVDETLRLVKAFQFTDQYGEVCPANWTEGSATMKANPTESLAYFSKANAANGNANGADANKRKRVD